MSEPAGIVRSPEGGNSVVRVLISYYSESGNTEKLAKAIAKGAVEVLDVEVQVKRVEETSLDDLLSADAIVMGSPTYYGLLAAL